MHDRDVGIYNNDDHGFFLNVYYNSTYILIFNTPQ